LSNQAREVQSSPERRPDQRRRFLLGGIITFADGAVSFDCVIRNQSVGGAKISHDRNVKPPAHFHLINIRDRVVYEVDLIWSKESESGVAYKTCTNLSDITDPALGYLGRLWLSRAGR
jgi:hypothetical protein